MTNKVTRKIKKADKKQKQGLKAAASGNLKKSARKMTKSTKLRNKALGGQSNNKY